MDMLKKFFPFSFKTANLRELIIRIAIYLVASVVIGALLGLLGKVPLIGFVFNFVAGLVGLYCLVGVVLAVLDFLKMLK